MAAAKRVVLADGETMKQRERAERFRQRLDEDAGIIHRLVRNNPGLPGRKAIAELAGLTVKRTAVVMRAINSGETGHARLEYGVVQAKGGRYASADPVRGWYSMDKASHHHVMDQADDHSYRIVKGVQQSRTDRLIAVVTGFSNAEAVMVRNSIAARLGLAPDQLQELDELDEADLEDLIREVAYP